MKPACHITQINISVVSQFQNILKTCNVNIVGITGRKTENGKRKSCVQIKSEVKKEVN